MYVNRHYRRIKNPRKKWENVIVEFEHQTLIVFTYLVSFYMIHISRFRQLKTSRREIRRPLTKHLKVDWDLLFINILYQKIRSELRLASCRPFFTPKKKMISSRTATIKQRAPVLSPTSLTPPNATCSCRQICTWKVFQSESSSPLAPLLTRKGKKLHDFIFQSVRFHFGICFIVPHKEKYLEPSWESERGGLFVPGQTQVQNMWGSLCLSRFL